MLAAEVVSNFGAMLRRLAIPWIGALTLDATPLDMGLLLVADVAGAACGALLLGAAIDRTARRRVMVLADLGRAALIAGVAFAVVFDRLAFWMLVVAAAGSGMLTVAFELARSAWIAESMPAPDLPRRNAQLAAGSSLSETAAFALGGWLFQSLGALMALMLDAISCLLSAWCLRGVPAPQPSADPTPHRSIWRALQQETRDGMAAVRAEPSLRALAVIEVLLAAGMSLAGTSYLLYVTRELAVPLGWQGMIFALGGAGALIGAAMAPALGQRLGSRRALIVGLALLAAGTACIPLAAPVLGLGGVAALLALHQIVGDAGHTLHDVHDRTLRQTLAPPRALARVDASLRTLGQVTTLVVALLGGSLATELGTRSALVLSAALFATAALYAAWRLGSIEVAPPV